MTSKSTYSLLRVLDLEGVYRPSLQGVLHKLVLLRYLGLRCMVLDLLPSAVADLHYMETLDIKHTNITSLPSSFWKARSSRHLHLNWFYINLKSILKACSNNVMALTKLQTLSGSVVGEVEENWMTVPMDSFTTLKLFLHQLDGDTSGAAGKAIADLISFKLANLQSLTFGVTKKAKPVREAKPATSHIGSLPKLSLAEKHHELLELYLLGQLNKPRRFAKDGFPSLIILKIWKLPRLQEVIIEPGAMLQLKELEFRHLYAMKNVQGIDECKELENIIVITQSNALVDQLEGRIGEKTNLHFRPAYVDDDEDDRYGTILNLKPVLYP